MVLVITETSLKLDAVLMDDLLPGSVITVFSLNKALVSIIGLMTSFECRSTNIIALLKSKAYETK